LILEQISIIICLWSKFFKRIPGQTALLTFFRGFAILGAVANSMAAKEGVPFDSI
jgi:hypothetical protein